jgi:hypothetical protein
MPVLALTVTLLCLAAPAWAGELALTLTTPAGKPVPNASMPGGALAADLRAPPLQRGSY